MSKNLLTLETGLAVSIFLHGENTVDACDETCYACKEFKQVMGQSHTLATELNIIMTFIPNSGVFAKHNGYLAFCEHCQDGVNDSKAQAIQWSRTHLSKEHGKPFALNYK